MSISAVHIYPAILLLLILEIALFYHQLLGWLARPHEQKRLWHAILIGLLIPYNLAQNLIFLPDPNIPVPIVWQNILGNVPGYFISAYMPFYCYKTMELKSLRFHAKYGPFFILLPALYFFFIYYPAYGDILRTRRFVYILPAIYASYVLFTIGRSILKVYRRDPKSEHWHEMFLVFIAVLCWSASPLLGAYLQQPRWIIGLFNNTNFLLLNIVIMRATVKKYRDEYRQLQLSNLTLSERVKERTIELENANRQKTNAYANLIHETKTPLTLINNYLEDYMDKGRKDDLVIVKENLNKINKDINNLFELERYSQDLVLNGAHQAVNLSRLLAGSLRLFKCYCRNKKNIRLYDHIEEGIQIMSDPAAINTIINNLVENSIKYTDNGGRIDVELKTAEDRIIFQVTDTGIGVAPELHSKIFEPYYQITHPKTNYRGGMGIGLPLVKKIVESLQGQILIQSDPEAGPGTKISVLLSRHLLLPAENITGEEGINAWSGMEEEKLKVTDIRLDDKKQTLLLVEDNFSMVNFLVNLLSPVYNVLFALNGSEALIKLSSYATYPDMIISDIMMDDTDGFAFAEALSADAGLRHIPLIFLSAKYTPEDISRGLRLGAMDVIQKPFKTGDLLLKIASILQNISEQRKALLQSAVRTIGGKEMNITSTPAQEAGVGVIGKFDLNCITYHLSKREVGIARLVCEGMSYKEVGGALFIAESTVKKHVENIYAKTSCTNKVQLINKLQRASPGKNSRAENLR